VARTYQAEKPSECGGDRRLNFARRLGPPFSGQNVEAISMSLRASNRWS
jgi:hypothetical protein